MHEPVTRCSSGRGQTGSDPSISALVVTWHSRDDIDTCLHALSPQVDEVIVVDNHSSDGTAEWVRRHFPAAVVIANVENLGFAAAVNEGARVARGDYLLLLNPDTRVLAGAIRALADALAGDLSVAAAGGHLVDEAGRTQRGFTVRRFPSVSSLAADLLLLEELWPTNPWTRRYRALDLDYAQAQDVEQPAAACLMVRRTVFETLGGFDERFTPAWFEDVDFCRRLAAAGHRVRFVPDARVEHRGGSSLSHLPRRDFLDLWYRNMRHYVAKHHGRAAELVLRAAIAAGMMLRMFVSVGRGDMSGAQVFGRVLRSTFRAQRPHDTVGRIAL